MNEDELKEENAELYADYEALADEHTKLRDQNARLKAEVERLRNLGIKLDGYVDLLQAENERLRKAGDILLLALWLGVDEYSKEQKEKAEEEWNAANREQGCLVNPIKVAQYLPKPPTKEGKQS